MIYGNYFLKENHIVSEGMFDFLKYNYSDPNFRDMQQVYSTLSNQEKEYLENIRSTFNKEESDRNIYFKSMVEDGKVVGFIQVIYTNEDAFNDKTGTVYIAVNPNNRGKGYAKTLTKECIDYFKKNKAVDKLYWLANAKNTNSIKLAEACGFKLIRDDDLQKCYMYNITNSNTYFYKNFKDPDAVVYEINKKFKISTPIDLNKITKVKNALSSMKGTYYDRARVIHALLNEMRLFSFSYNIFIKDTSINKVVGLYPIVLFTYDYNVYYLADTEVIYNDGKNLARIPTNGREIVDILSEAINEYMYKIALKFASKEKIDVGCIVTSTGADRYVNDSMNVNDIVRTKNIFGV